MADDNVNIKVNLEGDDAVKSKLSSLSDSFDKEFDTAISASQKLAAGLAVITAAAVAFGYKSVEAFNAQEEVTTKLTTLILNQEGATMAHVDALKEQAAALQGVTTYGDEVVMSAQAMLATFDFSSEAIQAVLPSFLDMVAAERGAAVGMDEMAQMANGLGKAMQGNTELFTKMGFEITEQQKAMLENGDEAQRLATINEILGGTYEGVAAALRDTFQGQLISAKNTLGDLMELIGEAIASYLMPMVEGFNQWAESMGGAEGILAKLKTVFEQIAPWLPVIVAALIGGLIPAMASFTLSVLVANAALLPWILLGAAIGAAIYGLIYVIQHWGEIIDMIKDKVGEAWDWINEKTGGAFQMMYDVINDKITKTWEEIVFVFDLIVSGLTIAFDAIVALFIYSWDTIVRITTAALQLIFFPITAALFLMQVDWESVWQSVSDFAGMIWDGIYSKITAVWTNTKAFIDLALSTLYTAWMNTWTNVSSFVMSIWDGIKTGIGDSINWIIEKINKLIEGVNSIGGKLGIPSIPTIPTLAFKDGGIVPGSGAEDSVVARVSPGELILNKAQQKNLAGGMGGTINININGSISSKEVAMEYADLIVRELKLSAKLV